MKRLAESNSEGETGRSRSSSPTRICRSIGRSREGRHNGARPLWAGDSRRLYYYLAPGKIMSVSVATKPTLSASAPVVAQDLQKLRINPLEWDVMPDGRILAIQRGEGEDDITRFDIVLNWSQELREQMARAGGAGRAR